MAKLISRPGQARDWFTNLVVIIQSIGSITPLLPCRYGAATPKWLLPVIKIDYVTKVWNIKNVTISGNIQTVMLAGSAESFKWEFDKQLMQ